MATVPHSRRSSILAGMDQAWLRAAGCWGGHLRSRDRSGGVAVIVAFSAAISWAWRKPNLATAPRWYLLMLLALASCLPVYPFAGAPLAIWWSRHR